MSKKIITPTAAAPKLLVTNVLPSGSLLVDRSKMFGVEDTHTDAQLRDPDFLDGKFTHRGQMVEGHLRSDYFVDLTDEDKKLPGQYCSGLKRIYVDPEKRRWIAYVSHYKGEPSMQFDTIIDGDHAHMSGNPFRPSQGWHARRNCAALEKLIEAMGEHYLGKYCKNVNLGWALDFCYNAPNLVMEVIAEIPLKVAKDTAIKDAINIFNQAIAAIDERHEINLAAAAKAMGIQKKVIDLIVPDDCSNGEFD